jgi:hypothetical protein
VSNDDAKLQAVLGDLVNEAISLRMGAQLPRIDASAGELLEALLDVRRRMDRVESILSTVLQLRGVAARKHTALDIQVGDAWDEAAVQQRQHAVRDEFSSAKERAAATNLQVLDLRRLERAVKQQLVLCEEALESIRLRYRGLEGLRHDVLSVLRTRQWETSLDR